MIDRQRLQDLRLEIGEDDFSEVVEMFMDEMVDTLASLGDAVEMADPNVFHGLRGSALNLGFTDFATACTEAEKRAIAGQSVDVVHLDWLYRESVKALETELPAAAA